MTFEPMPKVDYLSEHPALWAAELGRVQSLSDLQNLCETWKELVPDALVIVGGMDEAAFTEYQGGAKKERKGRFAGEEWGAKYSAILMPEIMFKAAIIASEYKVPWGLAYIRMKEAQQAKP